MNREGPCGALIAAGFEAGFTAFSAIDRFLGLPPLPFTCLETAADLPALARLFEGLRFPGVEIADGALDAEGGAGISAVPPSGGSSKAPSASSPSPRTGGQGVSGTPVGCTPCSGVSAPPYPWGPNRGGPSRSAERKGTGPLWRGR